MRTKPSVLFSTEVGNVNINLSMQNLEKLIEALSDQRRGLASISLIQNCAMPGIKYYGTASFEDKTIFPFKGNNLITELSGRKIVKWHNFEFNDEGQINGVVDTADDKKSVTVHNGQLLGLKLQIPKYSKI